MSALVAVGVCAGAPACALAQSAVDPMNKRAWGEGVGWTNWRDAGGGAQGVRVMGGALLGFVWSERAGWINLASGTASVTINANGDIEGAAWSERGGWITFGTSATIGANGARLVDGRLRGYAWSERMGWLNLDSNQPGAHVGLGCQSDLNSDGVVGGEDISFILNAWGGAGPADLNGDGVVNGGDISFVLSAWGPC